MYAFSSASCTVAGGCDLVSAGFGTSAGFASEPFGKVGFGFAVSDGLTSAGFVSAGFTSAGLGADLASICEDNFVNFSSSSAIFASSYFCSSSVCTYNLDLLLF